MPHDADERAFVVSAHATVFRVDAEARAYGIAAQEFVDPSTGITTRAPVTANTIVVTAGGATVYAEP